MDEAQGAPWSRCGGFSLGTQDLRLRPAQDDEGRYGWMEAAATGIPPARAGQKRRGIGLPAAFERLQSRAQVTRLVWRWMSVISQFDASVPMLSWTAGKPLVKNYRAPEHAFARRYTGADLALLAEVDRALGMLSGPATACVLRRQRDSSATPGSSDWGRSRWRICTTCATRLATAPSASC